MALSSREIVVAELCFLLEASQYDIQKFRYGLMKLRQKLTQFEKLLTVEEFDKLHCDLLETASHRKTDENNTGGLFN